MSFQVILTFAGAGTQTLPINPVYGARTREVRGEDATPGPVIEQEEVWTLRSFVNSADSAADWTAIRDQILDTSDPLVKVTIQRDTGGGFADFHVLGAPTHERFALEELDESGGGDDPGAWSSNVPYGIVVRAVRPPSTSRIRRAALSFGYNEAGLATRRWSGSVRTVSGTSAEAEARTLGTLALPSGVWAFTTNGPEGLDVRATDGTRDTEAEWESVAQEFGEAVPGSVGTFSHEEEESVERDEDGNLKTVTTIRASAAGTGAIGYVRSLEPSSVLRKRIVNRISHREASCEFVIEAQDDEDDRGDEGRIRRRFRIRGAGFGPLRKFPTTSTHPPIIQRGGLPGFDIVETIEVTGTSVSSLSALPIPAPIASLADWQDGSARDEIPIDPIGRGVDSDQDVYQRTVSRTFVVNFDPPVDEMVASVISSTAGGSSGGAGNLVGAPGAGGGGAAGEGEGGIVGNRLTSSSRSVREANRANRGPTIVRGNRLTSSTASERL